MKTILSSVVLASLFGLTVFAEPAEDLTNRELKIWVESQNRKMRAWIIDQNEGMREWMEVKFDGIEARLERLEAAIYGNPHGGMRHDLIALRTKVDTVIWLGGTLVFAIPCRRSCALSNGGVHPLCQVRHWRVPKNKRRKINHAEVDRQNPRFVRTIENGDGRR